MSEAALREAIDQLVADNRLTSSGPPDDPELRAATFIVPVGDQGLGVLARLTGPRMRSADIGVEKRPEDRPASAHVLRERLRACAAAGRWTNARAAQWWAVHRHELRSGGAGQSAASAAVDARAPQLTVTRIAD